MVGPRKLKITKNWGTLPPEEKIISLEEAREYMRNYWPSSKGYLPVFVVVDGHQVVQSYEELVEAVNKNDCKEKELVMVNVELFAITPGG
jgi:hypothetical protein